MFKIGEFSRLSRVLVRMLRHYDKLGLLKPVEKDPHTGYRFYSADQLPRLNRILALRELDFSLELISGLLEEELSADELLAMFRTRRDEVEKKIRDEQIRLDSLEARIQEIRDPAGHSMYDVILREIGPQLAACLRRIVSEGDAVQFMFEDVERYINSFNARADEPPLSILHDREYREMKADVEVAVPLSKKIPESGDIRVRELAGIPHAACVVHTGRYATIYQPYNALLSWIEVNGYRMNGPIREVYLRYGADGLEFDLPSTYLVKGSSPFITELQLSVEKQ
jgi:DNA-binding transcriptional MerR regulator